MAARRPVYEQVANAHVLTDGLRPREVADRILDMLDPPTQQEDGNG